MSPAIRDVMVDVLITEMSELRTKQQMLDKENPEESARWMAYDLLADKKWDEALRLKRAAA